MRSWDDYKKTMPSVDPVFDYARTGNIDGLKEVLRSGTINGKDAKGYSPLMLAGYNGQLEATELLLSLGADPNSTDLTGNTILMGVAFKGHVEIVKLLIAHGADPRATNPKQQTALQFAQMFGRAEVAKLLSTDKNFSLTDQLTSWLSFIFPTRSPR